MDWEWLKSIWRFIIPTDSLRHSRPRRRHNSEHMSWRIDQAGHLIINGHQFYSSTRWTKQYFEEAVERLKRKIDETGSPVMIMGLAIEEHVAQSLWQSGVITDEIVRTAQLERDKIRFRLALSGAEIEVCVVTATYYSDYEFIVTGHPQGHVRVRDIPDPLALMANELVF